MSARGRGVAIGLAATLVLAACDSRGGEGEDCKSTGVFGAFYCDDGLVCNSGRQPPICEKPKSRALGEPCGEQDNCADGLWCNLTKCAAALKEGEPCPGGVGCGPGLQCVKDATKMSVTCQPM